MKRFVVVEFEIEGEADEQIEEISGLVRGVLTGKTIGDVTIRIEER